MFKLQRLEITGFKSFADHTEIVFTGSGITAVVGPNGCGKSNVSDAIAWVLGEQRAKSLRGGEMRDVVFQGTKNRKPGGMAEVVLHMVRDETVFDIDESELEDIDETLSEIDDAAVDMEAIEGVEAEEAETLDATTLEIAETNGDEQEFEVETVQAAQVGSARVIETKVKTKRHWRPRSFALDFAPGEAVSVTRRLYLSGESEYQLNGKTCRLRDITDLFAGTGLSGAHYAIVEQGRIGQILSAKPADRRSLIEEAAGISKFRARQRAAESRLDSARSNLSRITDIVAEVDKQVNSLRRQAAKTRRFKILQEEFRVLLRQLFAAEGRHLTALLDDLRSQLAEASKQESEMADKLAASEAAGREATQAARRAEESLAELRRIHAENALERDRAEREHIYKSEQVVNLNNRIDILKGEIGAAEERLRLLGDEQAKLRREDEVESAALAKAETELGTANAEYANEAAALAEIESSIESIRAELMQHTAAAERFDEIRRQLELNLEKLSSRSEGLAKEADRAEGNLKEFHRQAAEFAESLAAEEKKLADFTAEKDELVENTARAREDLRTAEAAVETLAEEHSARKHRLATLNELEEKKAVYTPQVQKLFAAQRSIGVQLDGVLADKLKVDQKAETAVETLFGNYLEAVIVRSIEDAKRVSAWLRENEIGRTALLVLDPAKTASNGGAIGSAEEIGGRLGVSGEMAAELRRIFPREMSARLVDDLAAALARNGEIMIDADGDMLIAGQLFVSGKRTKGGANESLLAFKRELSDLRSEESRLAKEIATARSRADEARTRLVELESQTVDLQSLVIKVDRGIHGLQIQVRAAREEIERAERHRKVVADDAAQIAAEIEDVKERLRSAAEDKLNAEAAKEQAETSLATVSSELSGVRSRVDAANLVLNEKRTVAATSGERRRSVQSALRRVENEIRDTETRLATQRMEHAETEEKIRSLHESITGITDRIASASDEVAAEQSELSKALEMLAAARDHSDAMSVELAEMNRQATEALNHRAEIEVRQAEAATELKNIAESCQHELNVSLTELAGSIELDGSFELEPAREEAERLRERLDNFGAINMLALEELGEAEERSQFLTAQHQDIVDSIAATEEALREIKQRSRDKFRSAFEAINANFTELFQELFGGGRGEMTLLESEDILEAGIEVVAQPPGKRLQNIMLLSGGEKAMTAIALVMAIFRYRPSPFCLLDEVDAPLDDANVGRFVGKIAEMAERTQFIVITHNKRTMEAARALYGVTMQEAGVSQIVSVKFE